MTEETRELVDRIRRTIKPETLRLVTPDGEKKPLGLGQLKTKWSRLGGILDSTEWAALECYDAQGNLLVTLHPDDDVDAAAKSAGDAQAQTLAVWTSHVDRMVAHVRGIVGDTGKAQLALIETLVARNAECEAQVSELQAALSAMTEQLRALMLESAAASGQPTPRDLAIQQAINLGARALGLPPPTWDQRQLTAGSPGNGAGTPQESH